MEQKNFRAPRIIFWTAFALRLAVVLIGRTYRVRVDDHHFNFAFEAGRIARALVTGRGYADPFDGPSGPTAWLPPAYPLLIALSFKLFGIYSRAAAFFLLACNSLFSALIVPAVYEIAARCFDAQGIARRASKHVAPVARWAAWLWAIYPAFLQYAIHWLWEMSLTTCLFTWALVLALRLRSIGEAAAHARSNLSFPKGICFSNLVAAQHLRWKTWSAFGLLWGGIALSNASLLLVFPASLLWILWPSWKGNLRGAALACIAFALVITPWVLRNQRTLHAFIPTRDNFGVELYQSSLFYHDVFEWGQAVPLDVRHPDYLLYAQMGEVAYSKMRGTQAIHTLATHKSTFATLTAERIEFFWIGVPHAQSRHPAGEFVRSLNYAFLSLSGLLGLALAVRRLIPGAALMALVFGLVPLVYYAVTVQARFRHPMEPLIAVLTVYLFRSTSEQPRSV